jgi:hypothetical protein
VKLASNTIHIEQTSKKLKVRGNSLNPQYSQSAHQAKRQSIGGRTLSNQFVEPEQMIEFRPRAASSYAYKKKQQGFDSSYLK